MRGARLNRAEIERAALTRTLPDQLQNAYDLYVQRKQITPQQKQDMLATAEAINGTYAGGGATDGGAANQGGSAAPKTADEWLAKKGFAK